MKCVYYTESPEKHESFAGEMKSVEQFAVEEFFDFPIEDDATNDVAFDGVTNGNLTDSSAITAIDSCNSSVSPPPCQILENFTGDFTNEHCVPLDDLPELEWLTNIEEESLSNEELENLNLINGMKVRTDEISPESQTESNKSDRSFSAEVLVPAKARSKRARTGPGNWTSRLLRISPTSSLSSDSCEITHVEKKIVKLGPKKSAAGSESGLMPRDGRKCLHCATDKTPQWRTGPKGPKTLCNACGVRYKSGRLVAEYRPASSPTFTVTKHSNSHRKVMELRRQKEGGSFNQNQHQMPIFHQSMAFDVSNGEDYLLDFQPGIH